MKVSFVVVNGGSYWSSLALVVVSAVAFLAMPVAATKDFVCHDDVDCNTNSCECDDRVHSLPGWNQPLPSPWYSGLVSYEFHNRTIHTHYVLILAEEEEDDDDDSPLIYWSNGGPGASSLFGLLTELGPLRWSQLSKETPEYRSTGIPTPVYNPYTWTRLGHLLIFDQPAPVGFSYCTTSNNSTPSASTTSPIVDCAGLAWTDELASANTFAALQAFYQKYPQFRTKDLFLTGESYAGIYIPTLAREIINYNNAIGALDVNDNTTAPIPLQGFAVGDGCLGTETGICQIVDESNGFFDFWSLLFLAGHNQIPLHTFQEVMRACKPFHETNGHYAHFHGSDICQAAVEKATQEAGGVYAYALYDECTYSNGMMMKQSKNRLTGALNDYPCGGDVVMEEYLKLEIVQKALHVDGLEYFSADNANGFAYTPTEPDLTSFYTDVALHTNVRVLIYNGDTDPAITSFATQNWTSHLGLETTTSWTPWTVDACRRMGGYVTRYQGDLDFLTIRGAGHMVPTHKPEAAFVFLQAWIQNKPYPAYDPNCTAPPPNQLLADAATTNTPIFAESSNKPLKQDGEKSAASSSSSTKRNVRAAV